MLLIEHGPQLPFPYSSGIESSKHYHMRELRVQSGGKPLRGFYAFDPRRTAILLIAGDKTGDDRFYLFIVSRPRSTKSLCREACVVGPDAASAESVRPL